MHFFFFIFLLMIIINIEKVIHTWWKHIVIGHPEIDTSKVQLNRLQIYCHILLLLFILKTTTFLYDYFILLYFNLMIGWFNEKNRWIWWGYPSDYTEDGIWTKAKGECPPLHRIFHYIILYYNIILYYITLYCIIK